MKKFELVFIVVFLQISFILVGLSEIQPGHQLVSPYVDATFLNSITGLGNSYNTVQTSFNSIQLNNIFSTQELVIPVVNPLGIIPGLGNFWTSVHTGVQLPGLGFLGAFGGIVSLLWNLFLLMCTLVINSVIFAGMFYSSILLTLAPKTLAAQSFALLLGGTLGLLQMVYLIYEAITTITTVEALTARISLNWKGEK